MGEGLKKRLVGAAVLASLVVIFVPMLLDQEPILEQGLQQSNIPPRPEREFSSQVLPSESENLSIPPPGIVTSPSGAESSSAVPRATPPVAAPTEAQPDPATQEPKPVPASAAPPQRTALSSWVIQVASFSSRENADNLLKKLRGEAFDAFVEPAEVKGKRVYRVRIGPEIDRRQADKTLLRVNRVLKSQQLEATLSTYP